MLDKNTLRSLIRDVIAEEVRNVKAGMKAGQKPADIGAVRIATDADLAAFAKSVLTLAEDPKIRAEIQAGRHPFHLASGSAAQAAIGPAAVGPAAVGVVANAPGGETHRIDKGVVTESTIARLPKGITRLVVAAGVSVTPLARDKAKTRKLSIERIGP